MVRGSVGLLALAAACAPPPPPATGAPDDTALGSASTRRCGNEHTPEEWAALQTLLAHEPRYRRALAATSLPGARRGGRDVDVYVHVFHAGSTGRVSQEAIERQIDVLNYDFAYTGWRFDLASVTWDDSAVAHRCVGDGTWPPLIWARHQGDAGDLNLYLCDATPWLGITLAFPWEAAWSPAHDGVIVDWRTLPGGTMASYDRGHTATHEVGHWMGLFHTFQGGCAAPGDEVADTPHEQRPSTACDLDRDSCPGEGLDPVENFMDYTDDDCLRAFTAGQAARMDALYAEFRAGD